MITERFGEDITYNKDDKSCLNDIATFVKDNGFDDFSPEGITSYLTFRHPIGNTTMFEGYSKIDFGNQVTNNIESRYWSPEFSGSDDSLEDAIFMVDELLANSINNLIKDCNQVGVAMSGGIDSSLITGILRDQFPHMDIYTYSAGFHGDDEFEFSRSVADDKKTIHKEILLGPEDCIGEMSILKPLIKFKGSPLHPNELALATIEEVAQKDGCDIVLCGEGADDIFGGYGQNFRMYINYDHKDDFFKYFLDNYRYFSISDREIINPKYLTDDYDLLMRFLPFEELDADIRNWAFYFTQRIHTPGLITRGANAMRYNGLPLGFPFIDHDLVDFANRLPFEYKVAWKPEIGPDDVKGLNYRDVSEKYDIPKFIIKKVAENYLERKIIYRRKKGFPVPYDKWFQDINDWDLDGDVFASNDLSCYNGWKKFMLINLDSFIKIFNEYRI